MNGVLFIFPALGEIVTFLWLSHFALKHLLIVADLPSKIYIAKILENAALNQNVARRNPDSL